MRTEQFLRLSLIQSEGKGISVRTRVRDVQVIKQKRDIAFPDAPAKDTLAEVEGTFGIQPLEGSNKFPEVGFDPDDRGLVVIFCEGSLHGND
jgi:hypothetical protein